MHYHFGPVVTELSDQLRDETVYTFRDPGTGDALTVTFDDGAPFIPPEACLASRVERLRSAFGDALALGPLERTTSPVGPAAQVEGTLADGEGTTLGAAYVESEARSIFIEWVGKGSRPPPLRAAVQSLSGARARQPVLSGLVRRWVGQLSLEVPESYQPPSAFRFATRSLRLECFLEPVLAYPEPKGEEVAYLDSGRLELVQGEGPTNVSIGRGGRPGVNGSWVFARYDAEETLIERYCVRQLALTIDPATSFRVRGTTASADWAHLTEIFHTLLAETGASRDL